MRPRARRAVTAEMRFWAATHVGLVRPRNEDGYLAWGDAGRRCGFFAVADGLGGHTAGEVASRTALEAADAWARRGLRSLGLLPPRARGADPADGASAPAGTAARTAGREAAPAGSEAAPAADSLERLLRRLIRLANRRVFRLARSRPELAGMGTTLTALLVAAPWLAVAHVGDSRAYLLRGGRVRQLTSDHSLAEEMVRTGELSEGEARVHPQRHYLTRALGVEARVEPDLLVLPYRGGDLLVLATDGVTRLLGPEEMAAAVLAARREGAAPAQRLVALANERGGYDNATCVVVELG